MLDKFSPVPLYYQLKEEIRSQIIHGEIKKGDKLLSESEMIKKYKIGRLTVREALAQLVNEGYLEKKHGLGTFCLGIPPLQNNLNISVLLDTSYAYFLPYYIRGINDVLTQNRANFMIYDTKNSISEIASILERVIASGTSGIILWPSMQDEAISPSIANSFSFLTEHNIPYIIIDNSYTDVAGSFVVVDDQKGGYIATEFLIKLGHQRIGEICRSHLRDSIERERGYRKAIADYGMPLDERWILNDDADLFDRLIPLLRGEDRLTALVCYNDEVALKCLKHLKRVGISVPGDVSLVGYDDTVLSQTAEVPITTVAHPKDKLAVLAAEKLIELIEHKIEWPYVHVFEPKLVVRDSARKIR